MSDHPFFISMDLELATIRRRNLLTVISGLVAECDKEIARLKGMLELSA